MGVKVVVSISYDIFSWKQNLDCCFLCYVVSGAARQSAVSRCQTAVFTIVEVEVSPRTIRFLCQPSARVTYPRVRRVLHISRRRRIVGSVALGQDYRFTCETQSVRSLQLKLTHLVHCKPIGTECNV